MKKQILAISLVLGTAAIILSAGTMAFFTDTTETIKNTFTVGNVDIDLTEPHWNQDEEHVFMPGVNFEKDPTVTVNEGSQDAYVAIRLTFNNGKDFQKALQNYLGQAGGVSIHSVPEFLTTFVDGYKADEWKNPFYFINSSEENGKVSFISIYKKKLSAGESTPALFTNIKLPEEVTSKVFNGASFEGSYIDVEAAAVQADGIDKEVAYEQLIATLQKEGENFTNKLEF